MTDQRLDIGNNWQPPRCRHDRIILACPNDDCPEQNAYVAAARAADDAYYAEISRPLRPDPT